MKFKLLPYLLFIVFSVSAQQSTRVSELEKQRLATLSEIEETSRLLKENARTTGNALNRLNLLVQQIDSRKKMIQLLNSEIVTMGDEISSKETQTQLLEKELDVKKQNYAASLRKMYLHKNNIDNLLFILSSKSFSESFHRIMYLKAYSGWQQKQAGDIVAKQNEIASEKKLLLARQSEKQNLLTTKQSEEDQLTKEESDKQKEVKTLEKDKKKLQADLTKKEKQANALNRQIEKIIAEEVLKAEKEAKAAKAKEEAIAAKTAKETKEAKAKEAKAEKTVKPEKTEVETGENRVAEVKGGYAMTKSERILSSTFAGNKGRLPFPLSGSYKIVGYFGVHQHKELSKIETNNNGIDIETTSGNEAKAVFDGVVSRVFTLPGYNNSIIVRHGNYLTLYSNLEQTYVKQGNTVKTGQTVGKIYTDKENGNSTLLHFEIWKEQTKLDPLSWIKQ